jgi:hypothetical protein
MDGGTTQSYTYALSGGTLTLTNSMGTTSILTQQ